jgi:hypothetical protein
MVFYGTAGKQIDLGSADSRKCEVCGETRPFRVSLVYRYFHLYWIFRCVIGKQYLLTCEACGNGPEVEAPTAAQMVMNPSSSIPAWDRYGLAALVGVFVAFIGIAIAMAPASARRDASGMITGSGEMDAFDIETGDCFDDEYLAPTEGVDGVVEVTDVAAIPCSQPHDNEVYAVFDVDLPEFPGGEEMFYVAESACLERFEEFVGNSYEASSLDILHLYPTKESWTLLDDREVVCALYDMRYEKLVGSARGTAL